MIPALIAAGLAVAAILGLAVYLATRRISSAVQARRWMSPGPGSGVAPATEPDNEIARQREKRRWGTRST